MHRNMSFAMTTEQFKNRTNLVEVIEAPNQISQSPEVNLIEFIDEKGLLEDCLVCGEPACCPECREQSTKHCKYSGKLWCDLKTDLEKYEFLSLGVAHDTGIIAAAIQQEIANLFKIKIAAVELVESIDFKTTANQDNQELLDSLSDDILIVKDDLKVLLTTTSNDKG